MALGRPRLRRGAARVNQSNQSGNRVTTSICISPSPPPGTPGRHRRGAPRRRSSARRRDQRHEQLAAVGAAHPQHLTRRQLVHRDDDADLDVAVGDRAALELLGPELALVELRRAVQRRLQVSTAQRLGVGPRRRRRRSARSAAPRFRRGARRRGRRSPTRSVAPGSSSIQRPRVTWNEPSRPCGRPTRPACSQSATASQSTMSTMTRLPSWTAAARMTERSALAVRPPRPMTLP